MKGESDKRHYCINYQTNQETVFNLGTSMYRYTKTILLLIGCEQKYHLPR